MVDYLFALGRANQLCRAELEAVLTKERITFQIIFSSLEILHIATSQSLDDDYLIRTLGGTIKIAEVFGQGFTVDRLASQLMEKSGQKERITFGLSAYQGIGFNVLKQWNEEIKEKLEKDGLKARFILPTEGTVLSSVVVKKQTVVEYLIVNELGRLIFAKTVAIQDFEDWNKRDFDRPAPDPKKGMLPPKVARMMMNIGILPIQDRNENVAAILDRKAILDPFCGVGTILAEGLTLGLNVIGSDQSYEAMEKTRKNLAWLTHEYKVSSMKYKVFQGDATHISERLPRGSIDSIVTEPYLGPVVEVGSRKLEVGKIRNIILGLEKLYLGCFKDWFKILKPTGRVVIALPSFKLGEKEFFVKKPLDSCENLGYTLIEGPFPYYRPHAIVRRNIYVLGKN